MTNQIMPVRASAQNGEITLRFDGGVTQNDLLQFAAQMQEMFESIRAKIDHDNKSTHKQIAEVKNTVESKHISPQDLSALETIVSEKAKMYVDKKGGIQTNIDMFLNGDSESLRDLQRIIKKHHGKVKQQIWVELNKECLERKGTDPKNRIKDTQVEQAFDFVRRWGGFSI